MSFGSRMVVPVAITTPPVALPATINASAGFIAYTFVEFYLFNTGRYETQRNSGFDKSPTGTWLTSGTASQYEARFTVTSQTTPGNVSGSTSVWESLGSTVSWSVTAYNPSSDPLDPTVTEEAIGTLEIRDAATQTVLTSSELTLSASASAGLMP